MTTLRRIYSTEELSRGLTQPHFRAPGWHALARAISMSRPTTAQPFFDTNLRQWQLTIAYISDTIASANPQFSRQSFMKECMK